jgi:hypothetical protein
MAKAGAATTGGNRPSNRSRSGQLGRDARAAGMDLGADMMRDQAHDALAIGGRQPSRRCRKALRKAGRSRCAHRVQHHLDDGRVFQKRAMAGPSAVRSIRAPRAIPSDCSVKCHPIPDPAGAIRRPRTGMIKRARNQAQQQGLRV